MRKLAFIFSGQGSQYVGMGKDLYDNYSLCKKIFDEADNELKFKISEVCFYGDKEELCRTENTQPAVLTISTAISEELKNKGIVPDVVAGLSLGEYSALVCNKALTFKDAVKLVRKRGKYMEEAVPKGKGAMTAILGLSNEKVKEICKKSSKFGIVEPANFNCSGQVVIGGERNAVEEAGKIAQNEGAFRVVKLQVSGPFHTSMLKSASDKLKIELEKISVNDFEIPIITNVTGDYVSNKNDVKALLEKQVISSVLWEKTIREMIKSGVDTFVEIGPGKVLSGFVKKIDKKLGVFNVQDVDSLKNCIAELGGKC